LKQTVTAIQKHNNQKIKNYILVIFVPGKCTC
jgi:hypothetical protein